MKRIAFLLSLSLILFSCNSGTKKSADSNSSESSQAKSTSGNDKTYDCLKQFQDQYDELLSKEEMAAIYPIDFETAKENLTSGSHGNHIYTWPSDRPDMEQEIAGMNMSLPDNNTMGVKSLSFYPDKSDLENHIGTFNMGYKPLSEAEINGIEANLDNSEDDVKKTGKKLMKTRAKMKWEFVDGLGSSAWYQWNEQYGGKLAVLGGRAKFNIISRISTDPAENLEIAKKLAQKVLDKCN